MDITGAIFDCDGTLVDSMGMWLGVWDWLCDRHGIGHVPIERIEALSIRDSCRVLCDEFGAQATADELYEEVCAHVRDAYAHEVPLMPGARAFLQELADAHVPMAIASSTPVRELRCALAAHGLEGFFQDVVSTEDVGGRDKEFPDVYLEALRRLGTSLSSTWVFEDAPFGVATSQRAGFPVVGLMNDHDGRREEDIRPHCDLFVYGYPELSLALIHDYERPCPVPSAGERSQSLRALVVDGSPEPSSPELVARLAAEADYVVVADGGADVCRAAGVTPDVFCGDEDSASGEAARWAEGAAASVIRFPSDKYATDLSLALDCAAHEAARRGAALDLTLTCASGGRPDHALAVLGQLAAASAARARLVEDAYELHVLKPEGEPTWHLGADANGRTFSAVALAFKTQLSERGMHWELDHKNLPLLGDLGISNKVTSDEATVTCHSGAVAAFLLGE